MSSHIRRLKIERFRGIEALTWHPTSAINIILGGGNVGKTTILDAIALLFYPTNRYPLTDSDYWRRDVDSEFLIEAVMSLPEVADVSQQTKMNWPWEWNGEGPALPATDQADDDRGKPWDPVYVLRVRGTSDLELAYETIQPDDSVVGLSVGLRRAVGLVRLSDDDRHDRELRLVYGSSLDRLLGDKGLRSRLGHQLATDDLKEHLTEEAQAALSDLNANFARRALPTKLGLGITGGPGISLNALVGLTADENGVTLPLASWGAGTRRLAALAIADTQQRNRPITVVDEFERGLEPYRQRTLMKALGAGGAQVFITTHSAAALAAASDSSIWYLDAKGQLGRLPNEKIAQHQRSAPDTFLARLAVVCEGATEVGFVRVLLEKAIDDLIEDHGVWITDGGGHDRTLDLLVALSAGGLSFAGMVDNEGRASGRWTKIKNVLGDLLFQWPDGCLEQHVIPLFEPAALPGLIEDPEGTRTGMRLRSLADRLEIEEADIESIKAQAGQGLTQLIVEAATGHVPEKFVDADKPTRKKFKGHASVWFKSTGGGSELAEKLFTLNAWPKLQPETLRFLNAIRRTIELPPIKELPR
ncbi:MAG: AAA family ATPase [bacterium]|nr:AAA family ATPase [bacterium]